MTLSERLRRRANTHFNALASATSDKLGGHRGTLTHTAAKIEAADNTEPERGGDDGHGAVIGFLAVVAQIPVLQFPFSVVRPSALRAS